MVDKLHHRLVSGCR